MELALFAQTRCCSCPG